MKLTLVCEEGFKYIGWQRVQCMVGNGGHHSIAFNIMVVWNYGREPDDPMIYKMQHNLFVLSGESFTLGAFAQTVKELLAHAYPGIAVEYKDGQEEVVQC